MADNGWWYPTAPTEENQFQIHARLLGGALTTDDILPSTLLATVFLALTGLSTFRFYQMYKIPKESKVSQGETLLVLAVGLFAMSLAFFIRAAAGNVSATNLALATVLAEQILFTIGYILLVDVGITLMRDLHLQGKAPVEIANMRYLKLWNIIVHAGCITSIIISAIGFSQLPTATSSSNSTHTANTLRLVGAFLPFVFSLLNLLLWCGFVNLLIPLYKYQGQYHLTKAIIFGLVVGYNWLTWPAAFYAFVQVAVTSDDSGLVNSKIFFYLSFGLFAVLGVLTVIAINIRPYLEQGLFKWPFPGKGENMTPVAGE